MKISHDHSTVLQVSMKINLQNHTSVIVDYDVMHVSLADFKFLSRLLGNMQLVGVLLMFAENCDNTAWFPKTCIKGLVEF